MIRAFIAVELTPDLLEAVAKIQAQVKDELMRNLRRQGSDARVQWVRSGSMHVTLKFLGNVAGEMVPELEHAMAEVAQGRARFMLQVGRVGVFPDARSPRVLWIGLSGQVQDLIDLAGDLDRRLERLGFSLESKPFQPHLTLARVKDGSREVGRVLASTGLMQRTENVGTLNVSGLSLMKSDLRPSGAVYTRLREVRLRGSDE